MQHRITARPARRRAATRLPIASLGLTLALAACAGSARAQDFVYNDFSSISGLTLAGKAAQEGSVLRLTPALANQNSAGAWYTDKVGVKTGFSSSFTFDISEQSTPNDTKGIGGDGLSFNVQTITNTAATGDQGLGSVDTHALSFDLITYHHPQEISPDGNEIKLYVGGALRSEIDLNATSLDIRDGSHTVDLDYDGALFKAKIDGTQVLNLSGVSLGLAADANGKAWVGFGARTVAAYENHDITSWNFHTHAAPGPDSVAVFGLGIAGLLPALRRRRARV